MHGRGGRGRCHGRAVRLGGRSSRFLEGRGNLHLHSPTAHQNYHPTIRLPNRRPVNATSGYIHRSHGARANRGGRGRGRDGGRNGGGRRGARNGGRNQHVGGRKRLNIHTPLALTHQQQRVILTEEKILEYGLEFAKFTKIQIKKVIIETNRKRFRNHYGVGAKAVAALVKDLPPSKCFNLYDLLMAINFAKTYNTKAVQSGSWTVCVNKLKKSIKCYFEDIQLLKNKKICVGKFENTTIFGWTVDGVHFRTQEDRKNPNAKVYSHKFSGPGIAYEIGISIYEDRVLWIKGPFVASTHDATMFRSEGGLHPEIPTGMRGVADSAYTKLLEWISTHRPSHSKEMTNFINRVRARHENINARIKTFDILSETFRGSWGKREEHKMFVEAICVLIQYDMENGYPLMEI